MKDKRNCIKRNSYKHDFININIKYFLDLFLHNILPKFSHRKRIDNKNIQHQSLLKVIEKIRFDCSKKKLFKP